MVKRIVGSQNTKMISNHYFNILKSQTTFDQGMWCNTRKIFWNLLARVHTMYLFSHKVAIPSNMMSCKILENVGELLNSMH